VVGYLVATRDEAVAVCWVWVVAVCFAITEVCEELIEKLVPFLEL